MSNSITGAKIVEEPESYQVNNEFKNAEGVAYAPNAKVEINIAGEDLPKSNQIKVFVFFEEKVYHNGVPESKWILVGSTEPIKGDQNPNFTKSFIFEYYFQYIQNLRFVVFNMLGKNDGFITNDYIGYVEKSIGELLIDSRNKKSTYEINGAVPYGMKFKERNHNLKHSRIIISLEEVANTAVQTVLNISCKDLDKMDVIGKSDPFIVISKELDNGNWTNVYTSSVKKRTLNPSWKQICIDITKFNSGNDKKLLKFEVFDWDKNSKPDFIGKFEATFETIKAQKTFELIDEAKREKKKNYKNSGVLTFDSIEFTEGFSFSTFPLHGTEIAVVFAIDFTSSNGNPKDENSLHKIIDMADLNDFRKLNKYQQAISAIGYVLEVYDTNKKFAVYGYGAKFNGSSKMRFDYPLNGNESDPNVEGINGVLNAYYKTLENVELGTPTNFAPIINKICHSVKKEGCTKSKTKGENILNQYTILTIITDGEISDMKETIEEIQKASELPISIIIVGVGDSDFTNMEKLDGDDRLQISDDGDKIRDVVQFVQLSKYVDNPVVLASETLAEVPRQFYEFISENNCVPPDSDKKH